MRDMVSGPVEAVRIHVTHRYEPTWRTRLRSMRWTLDGERIAERTWIETDGAPAFVYPVFDGIVSAGDHELVVIAEYAIYTCCYACGYMQTATIRTTKRFSASPRNAVEVCMASGEGGPLVPIETRLAATVVACSR